MSDDVKGGKLKTNIAYAKKILTRNLKMYEIWELNYLRHSKFRLRILTNGIQKLSLQKKFVPRERCRQKRSQDSPGTGIF